jgi:hypothetical protein
LSLEDEPSNRVRWLGAALILLALAALIWQASEAGRVDEPPPPAVVEAEAPEARPSLNEMLASVNTAKLGVLAASASAWAAPGASAAAQDEVELCGVGRVKADEIGQPKDREPLQLAAQRARERVLPTLINSPDEVTRAAGLLLQITTELGSSDKVMPANAFARDALANMAVATRSPQVYAWAMTACRNERGEGMCQLLSTEQWARLEPDNAAVWLRMATDAKLRGDAAGVAEAMYRASRASKADMLWGVWPGVVLSRLPPDTPGLSQAGLAEDLVGVEAAVAFPHMVASQYCSVADVRDANRQQICAAVADVLSTKGTTLMDLGVAAAIGQRVGWSAERVKAVRDERDAIAVLQTKRSAATRGFWSCVGIDQWIRQLIDTGQLGEMAVGRRMLKASPESAATIAQRNRESHDAQRPAEAASAASAAAAASATVSVADR